MPALSYLSALAGPVVSLANDHNHPSYFQLAFLTFQAVVQVVIQCLLGFWGAHEGLLNPSLQKNISQLNVQIFTPCLIFVKLSSAITADKLLDLAIIPFLFVVTTLVSFCCGHIISRLQRFDKRETNFVIAMAVFGNSNSLPVSLTVALAHTLPALQWLPTDTGDSVASRGILYLLIFQQLGQMLRWSWGYNTLLARYTPLSALSSSASSISDSSPRTSSSIEPTAQSAAFLISQNLRAEPTGEIIAMNTKALFPHDYSYAAASSAISDDYDSGSSLFFRPETTLSGLHRDSSLLSFNRSFHRAPVTPEAVSRFLQSPICQFIWKILLKMNSFMNPPLWSMLLGLTVAIIRPLQHLLFETEGFIANTFTIAVTEISQVAVPLILVVLGGNLYPDDTGAPASPNFKRLISSSLIARMVMPATILLPVLALFAKFVHISIVDDPIFLVVLFLLTTAPPAIQLSQICQLNEVFEREMASILFWGYVVLTLPITMIMVVMSLEVLEWAGRLPA
ncbi:auxin efflux carrier [Lipomyces oligophaga]|uniref:auxin efflux carrier n=1 Tax=Lipomyces oligophaga TaxID=45792 RepID=UPI0034CE38FC